MIRKYIHFILITLIFLDGSAIAYAQSATITPGPIPGIVQMSVNASIPQIIRELGVGSTGDDVKFLQKFLAAMPDLYPEKLVTGYYGSLTKKAVEKFQKKYVLTINGRLDASTYKKINERWAADNTPIISAMKSQTLGPTGVLVSWKTDQPATTKIFYSNSALPEGKTLVISDSHLSLDHAIEINHLTNSTTYYYTAVSGNSTGTATSSTKGNVSTL